MASVVLPDVLPDQAGLRRALGTAVRAPSVYNSQPWRLYASTTAGVDRCPTPGAASTTSGHSTDVAAQENADRHTRVLRCPPPRWPGPVRASTDVETTHRRIASIGFVADFAEVGGGYGGYGGYNQDHEFFGYRQSL